MSRSKRSRTISSDSSDSRSSSETLILTESNLPRTHRSVAATPLAPLECDGSLSAFHPTLLIGVGRTGCLTLKFFKEMLHQRFGHTDQLPALKMLCLDTDIHDLSNITNSCERSRFRDDEVLPIPLKDSNAYRKTGDKYSRWLSRRWIFNVPRSFTTEGIRPLGRLAFADHSQVILDRLHKAMPGLSETDLAESSAKYLGLPMNSTPRTFIVGSLSGGVGSGMIADLAYAVRTVLQENGISDEHLVGMLYHGHQRFWATQHSLHIEFLCGASRNLPLREARLSGRSLPSDCLHSTMKGIPPFPTSICKHCGTRTTTSITLTQLPNTFTWTLSLAATTSLSAVGRDEMKMAAFACGPMGSGSIRDAAGTLA